jgi:RHH-type proline utilization regulon transcriptional repressor/proline dehydrogenase/delta 1-pyrroline-5-carboxylate dehydrogenase
VEELIADPATVLRKIAVKPHPRIPLPVNLYGEERCNARGINLADVSEVSALARDMTQVLQQPWNAAPLVDGEPQTGVERLLTDPSDRRRVVGRVFDAGDEAIEQALASAARAADGWTRSEVEQRAQCLERTADLLEAHCAELMALCVREAGKSIEDALAEVREASDFCRYYAACARKLMASPQPLPGPTGESNEVSLHGRGVFVCISPWNFPLAIFTGQVAAALVAGNAVIAKPAEQTPLVAARTVSLLHEAGVPPAVLQLLPGAGEVVGARLVADARIDGVVFTGSTETARLINETLARRAGPIVPLIAETGGQNAMIVDSSALPEQVVTDAIASAFNSAGQRCSALRVLFLQQDVAPRMMHMLAGAMAELSVGDPALLSTDVGPVIDADAQATLQSHVQRMRREARLVHEVALPEETAHGTYVAPCAFELSSLELLQREVFGPVLHVIPYAANKLGAVIDAVNATGYGLTLGIHSRIDETVRYIQQRARVGNTYVNRNIIGATVGVQPFGGEGLSGTGPKAGGPHYLYRFTTERTLTVNTAAVGGNTSLFAISGDES